MKTYIIRLEENEHSCKMAQDCYDQATKFNLQPEFFKAINGLDVEKHYASTGVKRLGKFKKNRPGVDGCFFSHYYLWKQCIDINEPIIVLEHDGYVIRHIDSKLLDNFDDVLKLDNLDPFDNNYNKKINLEKDLDVKVIQYKFTNKKVFKVGLGDYFKGAYSYIIKPQGAKKLIDFISKNGHRPSDQQINSSILDLKTTTPTVARLHPFYSVGINIKISSLTGNPNLLYC
jgi:glycosyl transferase family 25